MLLYFTVTFLLTPLLFSHFLKLSQYARSWMNLPLGADVPYELLEQHGVLFYQLPSAPDTSETNQQSLMSCFLHSALPQSAVHECKPRNEWVWASHNVWTWKYSVKWRTSMDMALKNRSQGARLSGRQRDSVRSGLFLFWRESMYLMAQKVSWLPSETA